MAVPDIYKDNEFLVQGVQSLGAAFNALFNGDIAGMLVHLIGVLPLLGAFFIIWKLMEFVFVLSIFKDEQHHKYSRFIGLGIAMISILTPAVTNIIKNLISKTFVIIVMIILAVSATIMLWYRARKGHFDAMQGINQSRAANTQTRRTEKKQKHEENLEDGLRKKENDTIDGVDKLIKKNWFKNKTSLKLIDSMIAYLAKADSIGNNPQAKGQFQENLIKAANQASAKIKEEYLDTERLKQKIIELENFEMKTWKIHIKEGKLEHSLEKQFREAINKSGLDTDEKKERRKKLHIVADLENKLLYLDKQRKILHDEIVEFLGRIENLEKESILELKNQLTNYLHSGDFPSSINALHKIKSELETISRDEKSVYGMESKVVAYEGEKNKLEKTMNRELDWLTGRTSSYSVGRNAGRKLGSWAYSKFK